MGKENVDTHKEIFWDVTVDLEGWLEVKTIFNGKIYRAYCYVGETVTPSCIPHETVLINEMKRKLTNIIKGEHNGTVC